VSSTCNRSKTRDLQQHRPGTKALGPAHCTDEQQLEAVRRLCNTDSAQSRATDAGPLRGWAQPGQGPNQALCQQLPNRQCPDGEIGRRSGLKIRRPQGRGGSSPPLGTMNIKDLTGNQVTFTVAFLIAGACSGACCSLLAILSTTDNLCEGDKCAYRAAIAIVFHPPAS
jgi:hypothetical protein